MNRISFCLIILFSVLCECIVFAQDYEIVRTFYCSDATQGVAVDNHHFYAIGNQSITKYTRQGDSLATWKETDSSLIHHFDGGIIIDGLLYCSHSNYPEVPMASSIEIFDPETMRHHQTISFGIDNGSCTWILRGDHVCGVPDQWQSTADFLASGNLLCVCSVHAGTGDLLFYQCDPGVL